MIVSFWPRNCHPLTELRYSIAWPLRRDEQCSAVLRQWPPAHQFRIRDNMQVPSSFTSRCRRLDSIVKTHRLLELDATAIANVWTARHAQRPNVLTLSLPAQLALSMRNRMASHPSFILPVPRLTGHEVVFLEATVGENVAIQTTGLDEFRTAGSAAQPRATFTVFFELAKDKDIVLVAGSFDPNHFNSAQTTRLLHLLCAAYSQDALFEWIRQFRDQPHAFDFSTFMSVFASVSGECE